MSSSTPRPSFSHRPLLGRTPSGMPSNPILRPILGPMIRLFHVLSLPVPAVPSGPPSPSKFAASAMLAFSAAVQRLDLSLSPRDSLNRLAKHRWTVTNTLPLVFMGTCAAVNLYIMQSPGFPLKLLIPIAYIAALLVPLTSQFVLPATPVFAWLITFFSARFISPSYRPNIHVALLPALESVLYGANISDLQTRYTHPVLDILAWLPYGVLHFTLPFIVAFTLWVAGPKGGIQYWGRAFGFMNLLGVLTQLVLPCAAPWYEIIHGLTPADYSMPGSPGGLMRIDRVFHSQGYTNTFGHAPLVFGAFPSLHSGCAVMEALFLSHFFPSGKVIYWSYVGVLWWATMYLSHHYLIDLAGGACLSVLVFYLVMPEEFKDSDQIVWANGSGPTTRDADGYEMVNERRSHEEELDLDEEIRKLEESGDNAADGEDDHAAEGSADAARREAARKKGRTVSWGETSVMGENSSYA